MIVRLSGLLPGHPVSWWMTALACGYFVLVAVRLSVIDIRTHLLPNRIIFPACAAAGPVLVLACLLSGDAAAAARTVLAAVALWCFYLGLRLLHPAGMGMGDVKLALLLGLDLGFLGWSQVLYGTVAAFLLGGVWGVALIVTRRGNGRTQIPFGPFMLGGALASMLLVSG
ncbi:prepilin peptidase [Paenarthrobacter sp. Z7-10]|uniref:prepilin peptidase n=1 Tax=Paenarthrobacter sp. Z7-10 TaxID=2787635 RepID=UPI0022A98C1D|nr:A24 family peptidase [Paenarthrobacter sp. Z7-10]MCZ2403235.1 prepilin peptidase [Paenarthrobacter sp. Z7-10]